MYAKFGKRLCDIAISACAILLLSPLLLLLVVGARLSSPGPAIFRQQRIGRHGQAFEFLKFRSMPIDTGDMSSDKLGKVEIRPFGSFLRRTNLDELPQLFNVLRGEMSIVGPRPPIVSQVELVALRRKNGALACRPGLTGLAQVNSFNGMSIEQKAEYDAQYANSITFGHDLSIMLQTFGYLMKPPPVY